MSKRQTTFRSGNKRKSSIADRPLPFMRIFWKINAHLLRNAHAGKAENMRLFMRFSGEYAPFMCRFCGFLPPNCKFFFAPQAQPGDETCSSPRSTSPTRVFCFVRPRLSCVPRFGPDVFRSAGMPIVRATEHSLKAQKSDICADYAQFC